MSFLLAPVTGRRHARSAPRQAQGELKLSTAGLLL
jgi:hypothetical protein